VVAGFGPGLALLVLWIDPNLLSKPAMFGMTHFGYFIPLLMFLFCMLTNQVMLTLFAYRHLCRSLARRSYAF
jgi:hypothetical protein